MNTARTGDNGVSCEHWSTVAVVLTESITTPNRPPGTAGGRPGIPAGPVGSVGCDESINSSSSADSHTHRLIPTNQPLHTTHQSQEQTESGCKMHKAQAEQQQMGPANTGSLCKSCCPNTLQCPGGRPARVGCRPVGHGPAGCDESIQFLHCRLSHWHSPSPTIHPTSPRDPPIGRLDRIRMQDAHSPNGTTAEGAGKHRFTVAGMLAESTTTPAGRSVLLAGVQEAPSGK